MPAAGKQKVTPQSAYFSGSLLVSKENTPRQFPFSREGSYLLFFLFHCSRRTHARRER